MKEQESCEEIMESYYFGTWRGRRTEPPEEVQPPNDLLFKQLRELRALNSKDERICHLITMLEEQRHGKRTI